MRTMIDRTLRVPRVPKGKLESVRVAGMNLEEQVSPWVNSLSLLGEPGAPLSSGACDTRDAVNSMTRITFVKS